MSKKKSKNYGGKGLALMKLVEAGFLVPKFFIVPVGEKLDADNIAKAVKELGVKKLAVRSSAMIEDGKKHSFAGQFLTLLDVPPDKVIDAIRKVRASGPKMAVIVQEMIHGDESGVAFSVHPVTRNRDEIIIESVRGLGDKLVSGRATPTMKVLRKLSARTKLEKTVVEIEKHFSYPVDIEWTRKGRALYILQCRPITTL